MKPEQIIDQLLECFSARSGLMVVSLVHDLIETHRECEIKEKSKINTESLDILRATLNELARTAHNAVSQLDRLRGGVHVTHYYGCYPVWPCDGTVNIECASCESWLGMNPYQGAPVVCLCPYCGAKLAIPARQCDGSIINTTGPARKAEKQHAL